MMKKQFTSSGKMITKVFIFVLACFLSMSVLHAQTVLPNVKVNTDSYYDVTLDGGAKSIAALNDTIYAVWQGNTTDTTANIYFAKSIDGGISFSNDLNIFQGASSIYHAFPTLAVSQDGNIHIAWVAVTNNETDYNIWYTRSIDGGNTFQSPITITTNNGSVYPSIGAYNNNVYIFYANATGYPVINYFFVRSTNNGNTFQAPIQINDAVCTGNIEFDGVSSLALDPSGNICLAWVDGRRANGNGDIYFAKSTDGGQNFSTNVMVNDINQPGADSIQYLPSITADASNNIYVSFSDKRLGDDWSNNRVYIAKSNNGGSTFSSETLAAGHTETCKHHNIVANSNGNLYLALCTHVMPNWGVWLYESVDGGNSFSTALALSDSLDYDYDEVRLVSGSVEDIYALWTDDRSGTRNVYYTKIDFPTSISKTLNSNEFVLYPNPTNGRVFIKLPNNNKEAEIAICNLQGQLFYSKTVANTSILRLDLNIPCGIYFVNINSNKGTQTLKLIKK